MGVRAAERRGDGGPGGPGHGRRRAVDRHAGGVALRTSGRRVAAGAAGPRRVRLQAMGTAVASAHLAPAPEAPALPLEGVDVRALARRAAVPAALAAVAAAALVLAGGPLHAFLHAMDRAVQADPRWVVAAGVFELLSFAGYIGLFWMVGSRATPRLGVRASAYITLGGAGATRLPPAPRVGRGAPAPWGPRRAGLGTRGATSTLLSFLVLQYAVFLGALVLSGGLLALGVSGHAPLGVTAVPAAAAALAIATALVFAARRPAHATALVPGASRGARVRGRLSEARGVVGAGVRDGIALLGSGDLRLLGAPAYWAFDAAVLWAMLEAFGAAPAIAVVVLAYFVGQVGNTLPIPGAVSGGMAGVLIACGVPADLAVVSVLAYRSIAIWLPAPIGLAALRPLRRTVAAWAREDERPGAVSAPERAQPQAARVAPAPAGVREHDALALAA